MTVSEIIQYIKDRSDHDNFVKKVNSLVEQGKISTETKYKLIRANLSNNHNNFIIAFSSIPIKVTNEVTSTFFEIKKPIDAETLKNNYDFEVDDNNIFIPKHKQCELIWVPELGNSIECCVLMCNTILNAEDTTEDCFELWDWYKEDE